MASPGSITTKYSPLDSNGLQYIKKGLFLKYAILGMIIMVLFFLSLSYMLMMKEIHENHDVIRANLYATEEYLSDSIWNNNLQKHIDIGKDYYHNTKKLVCYYNVPTNLNRSDELQPDQLSPDLCTHINIAFARVENNTIAFSSTFNDAIIQVVNLKKKNPGLKVLLSIGGAGNNNGFPSMVYTHSTRKMFIKSVKKILYTMKLDGIDLDWEFPAVHGQYSVWESLMNSPNALFGVIDKRQKQHFTQLLREIRAEFIREKRDYILSVAVAAPRTIVMAAYDISEMNKYVDYVNIMTYDYHYYTVYTPLTGINSPLYETPEDFLYLRTLNINYTAHLWLDQGMERDKILLGLPTYGHSYYLRNPTNHGIGSPSSGYGTLGENGFVTYSEICSFLTKYNTSNVVFQNNTHSPYFYNGNDWVSFENKASITAKAQYIKDNNFGGAMIYSLNTDDTQGLCGVRGSKYPLTNNVNSVFFDTDL